MENRSESGFWKAVEQYEERFGNFEDISVKPHKYGSCNGGNHNKYKAYKCFINGFPYMAYEKTIFCQFNKTFNNPFWTAEYKRVDNSLFCTNFPCRHEENRQKNTKEMN